MKSSIIPNIEFSEMFGTYWMSYCIITSFCSTFFLGNGYTNTEIGILVALANLLSVIIQPVAADFIDRSKHFTVLEVIEVMCVAVMGLELFTIVLHGRSIVMFVAYILFYSIHASLQPLLNSVNITLAHRNIIVNYGICRGIGSLSYSIMSLLTGTLLGIYGIRALPYEGEITVGLLLVGTLILSRRYYRAKDVRGQKETEEAQPVQNEISMKEFLGRHRLFLVLCIGVFILYFNHQVLNYFLLQMFQNVGGGSSDMSLYYSIITLLEVPGLFAFSWLCSKFSLDTLMKVSALSYVLRSAVIMIARTPFVMFVSVIFHFSSFPIFLPAMVRYINEIMAPNEAVRGQSFFMIAVTASAMAASFTGGIVLDHFGAGTLNVISTLTAIVGTIMIFALVKGVRRESIELEEAGA